MARNPMVTVNVVGDATRLNKTFDQVEGKTRGFGSKMGSVLGAVGGVAAAQGIFTFAKSSVTAFTESEQSAVRLQSAFQKFPALNDSNIESFQKLNEQMAKKTRFDDDALASGQAVLGQFGLTGAQVEKLTPLLADYAARTGKDIPSAADALGKAMLGKGRALAEIGIKFKDAGSTGANFDQVMTGLNSKVGGFAEKEGKTASGQAEILRNQFGELQEEVGSKLVPILTSLAQKLLSVVNFFASLSPGIKTAIAVVIGLVGAAVLITKAVQAWQAAQLALNFVLTANPIGLIVIAIAALVAGIIWAYKNVDWFRDGVHAVFRAIAAAAEWLGRVFASIWGGIVSGFGWVRDTLKSIANWLIKNVVNRFIDGVNLLLRAYNKVNIGQSDIGLLAHLPTFHQGGVIPGPVGASVPIMAQAGETVLPIGAKGGGGATVVNINFNGVTTRETADQVVRVLEQHFARGGSLGNGRGGMLAPA